MAIFVTALTDLVVDTSIMAATDALGVKLGIAAPNRGTVRGIMLSDLDDDTFTCNVWFFTEEPTGIATNAVFDLANVDQERTQGVVLLPGAFDATSGQVRYSQSNVPYRTQGGVLWLQCALASGTPTFGVATDVKIRLYIEP